MIEMFLLKDRNEWLEERSKRIGGSDAASIVGMNPWKSNVELWEIKTKRKKAEETASIYAKYGTEAEQHLRALFILDYPQLKVDYAENNLFLNDKYPFAHASLDGWLTDQNGRKGILEIKTTTIQNPSQKTKWDGRIPDNYYCQVCWYMGVYEAEFAILKAQLKWDRDGEIFEVIKHYHVERSDVQNDIEYLFQKGSEFWEYCKNDIQPPLILPAI